MRLNKVFDKFKDINIIVMGDAMVDTYTIGKISRKSPEAPVSIVNVIEEKSKLGGAANVALNLKELGAKPILCSVIGDDYYGKELIQLMKTHKMTVEGLVLDSTRKTTVKKRIIVDKKHIIRIDDEITSKINNKNQDQLSKIISKFSKNSKILIFQDYDKGVLDKNFIQKIIKKNKNLFICVDPKKQNFNFYKNTDLFKPNLSEITNGINVKKDRVNSIESLKKLGGDFIKKNNIKTMILTLSERGLIIINKKEKIHFNVKSKKIIDVSGAGDTVISIASLLLYLKLPIKFIGNICNLSGSIVCAKSGVSPLKIKEIKQKAESSKLELYL
tara:strand:- start:24475 stop:25464 length:990 start_codon:yes stop_codon:yes gene_type:complete